MANPQSLPPVTPEPGTRCAYSLACSREAVVVRDMGMAVGATPMCQPCSDLYDRLSGR